MKHLNCSDIHLPSFKPSGSTALFAYLVEKATSHLLDISFSEIHNVIHSLVIDHACMFLFSLYCFYATVLCFPHRSMYKFTICERCCIHKLMDK